MAQEKPKDIIEKEFEKAARRPDSQKAVNTTLTPPEVDEELPAGADEPPTAGPTHERVPVQALEEPPTDDRGSPDRTQRSGGPGSQPGRS